MMVFDVMFCEFMNLAWFAVAVGNEVFSVCKIKIKNLMR
jgi:hypothetical protein